MHLSAKILEENLDLHRHLKRFNKKPIAVVDRKLYEMNKNTSKTPKNIVLNKW